MEAHTRNAITWTRHECANRHYELKHDSGHSEAHNQAQSRFDSTP